MEQCLLEQDNVDRSQADWDDGNQPGELPSVELIVRYRNLETVIRTTLEQLAA